MLKDSGIGIIVSVANMYFSIKAMIAMNNFAFESFNKNEINFDDAWKKTKGKFWRYVGASTIKGIFVLIGFLVCLYTYSIEINLYLKTFFIVVILIITGIFSIFLYLITYISSIKTKEKSYFSYNINIFKKAYKKIIAIFLLENIKLFVAGYLLLNNFNELFELRLLIDDLTIYSLVFGFLLLPIASTFVMKILFDSPYFENKEEIKNEEIV